MKKKILGGIAILALAAVVAINVNLNAGSNDLSDLSLANVEALASSEGDEMNDCSMPNGECPIKMPGGGVLTIVNVQKPIK